MGFLNSWYNREPKNEIKKDTQQKQGAALFFDVLWRELWNICKLNLILILFCIPVVTIPAAITAMSKVMILMFTDKPVSAFGDFFSAFKAEWKRATIAGLIYFPLLAITVFAQYFYFTMLESVFLYTIAMLMCAMVLISGFYLFPMIGVLDMNLKGIFKNAILLTFVRMPQNILALIIAVLLVLLVLMFLLPSIFAIFLILFSLIGFVTTFCAYTGLKKYVIRENVS